MTKIRFWNGLDTIGGNIVEVATETSRVICDFGAAGDLSAASLDNDYTPLEAGIVTGLIPAIPNLFETVNLKILYYLMFQRVQKTLRFSFLICI